MKMTASADHIVSRWGAGSSATGEPTGDWDKVTEFRLALRTGFKREFKTTSVFIGGDFQHVWIDGGPELSTDYLSVMTFSTQRTRLGASLRLLQRLPGSWGLQGAMRIEKVKGYAGVGFLPEISLFYKDGKTDFGLVSVHFSTSGSARHAGVDLTSAGFDTIFDTTPYENTPSHSNLNISLRLFDFWKKFEFQLSVHNALNDHARLPIVGGGTFLSRGREITLTLRGKF
jgi:hypothetical protein